MEPRITSTESNEGLIMTFRNDVYKFVCTSETNCQWMMEDYKLKIKREQYESNERIMMKAPLSMLEKCDCN